MSGRSPFQARHRAGGGARDRSDTRPSGPADRLRRAAQAKGATNILALDQSLAFIINVPHNRVITTLSQDEMKENIFTNIDGAVIL